MLLRRSGALVCVRACVCVQCSATWLPWVCMQRGCWPTCSAGAPRRMHRGSCVALRRPSLCSLRAARGLRSSCSAWSTLWCAAAIHARALLRRRPCGRQPWLLLAQWPDSRCRVVARSQCLLLSVAVEKPADLPAFRDVDIALAGIVAALCAMDAWTAFRSGVQAVTLSSDRSGGEQADSKPKED